MSRQWNRGAKKNWRYYKNSEDGTGTSSNSERERRPPGLRGKAIGKWYARRNKERNSGTTRLKRNSGTTRFERKAGTTRLERRAIIDRKPIGSIILSKNKKMNITKLLNETASMYPSTSSTSNSYEHLEETDFKHEFLQHISGSIIKKLQSTPYNSSCHKNENLDNMFLNELSQKMQAPGYKEMLEFRKKLPSMNMKDTILDLINKNHVIVISGETGCGKTTQVAQFILDDYIEKGRGSECKIICTQPRRISAISVSERVAQERNERLGVSAGYQIRMEKVLPRSRGSILYCTTGVLLKYMEGDPSISKASHLILDEIHERDVISDFLITVLKDVLFYRSDLKVILMSATLNAEAFSKYYNNAPHINIPGFTFPVTDYYLEDVLQKTKYEFKSGITKKWIQRWQQSNAYLEYIEPHIRKLQSEKAYDSQVLKELGRPHSEKLDHDLIYELLKYICKQKNDDGSILVFLPGFADIKTLSELITYRGDFPPSKYITIPLHSQLPTVDQKQIFLPPPKGMRKIILSTQIAETSITIEDVTTVIDCGFIKIGNLDQKTGVATLKPEWVTCANASQRRGRAGRVRPGVCYHLFSQARHLLLDKYLKPEVLRTSLEDVILQLKMLQLGDAEPFLSRLMDPPDRANVITSVSLLQRLGALDEDELLTPLGLTMAKLPVNAQCSKMLLMAALFSCLDPILSVVASLGYKDAFRISMDREADKKKVELSNGINSDHILMHYAIRGFEEAPNKQSFCNKYFLSMPTLRILQDIRKQLSQLLYEMKFITCEDARSPGNNRNSKNDSIVKAVIASGLYPNVAIKRGQYSKIFRSTTHLRMLLHPKSLLSHLPGCSSPLVVYQVRIKSRYIYIHDATYIFSLPIIFFGDQFKAVYNTDVDPFVGISINGTMRFLCTKDTALIIEQLRRRLNQILESKISNPGFVEWTSNAPEVKVLRTIVEMITAEDTEDMDLSDYEDT